MTRLTVLAAFVALAVFGSVPAQGSGPGLDTLGASPTSGVAPLPAAGAADAGGGPIFGASGGGAVQDGRSGESSGERELGALARAYPGQIAEAGLREGEWAVRVGERWFLWAGGRLLPEGLRADREAYAPYHFYDYPYRLPALPRLDQAARQRLQDHLAGSEAAPPERHEGFLGALYRAETRAATEAHLVTVMVLGRSVRVHEQVAEPLRAVAARLEELQRHSPEVRRFFEGIDGLAGYNWRPIAGTRSRSYHSYAIAVDLVPRSYGGRHPYWRWAMDQTEEWYALPYASRWMVPPAVVRAFETQGFIWGGKWFFFDTMHFEYRPEILILSSQARRFGC